MSTKNDKKVPTELTPIEAQALLEHAVAEMARYNNVTKQSVRVFVETVLDDTDLPESDCEGVDALFNTFSGSEPAPSSIRRR